MGKDALLTLEVRGKSIKAMVPVDRVPAQGSDVAIDFPAQHLHLFDANGNRMQA